eukprot:6853071-Prymnesium_polylepis.1
MSHALPHALPEAVFEARHKMTGPEGRGSSHKTPCPTRPVPHRATAHVLSTASQKPTRSPPREGSVAQNGVDDCGEGGASPSVALERHDMVECWREGDLGSEGRAMWSE